MKNPCENDMIQRIPNAMNQELDFLNQQESNANAIFTRLDQKEKAVHRFTGRVPVIVISLIILMTSAALAIGNPSEIAEWLGMKERIENDQTTVLLYKDDAVSLELVEVVTLEQNVILAVHAIPQQENLFLCPYYYALMDVPVGKMYTNIDEAYSDLTAEEYTKRNHQTIHWVTMSFFLTDGHHIPGNGLRIIDDWYLQADGSVMVFFDMSFATDIGPWDQASLALLKLGTMIESLSQQEAENYGSSKDKPTPKCDTVQIDWSRIPAAEPKCLGLDSYIQADSGVELRNIRLYSTPHTHTLSYMYRIQSDSVMSNQPLVLVAPVHDTGWVTHWETKEAQMEGETWIRCRKVFDTRYGADLSDLWFVSVQGDGKYFRDEFRLE